MYVALGKIDQRRFLPIRNMVSRFNAIYTALAKVYNTYYTYIQPEKYLEIEWRVILPLANSQPFEFRLQCIIEKVNHTVCSFDTTQLQLL